MTWPNRIQRQIAKSLPKPLGQAQSAPKTLAKPTPAMYARALAKTR